jgi:2-hydroxychromene-2-carboxylate isomerase
MTDKAPVDFYFDFISPFGYFAALRVDELCARHGRETAWHSMLLGVSVLKVMGLKPLLDTPLKGDYIRREYARYVRRHRLELKRQPGDPMMDPRPCGRAFHWVKVHQPGREKALAHALLHAYWVEGRDLGSAATAAAVAAGAGFDQVALEAAIDGEESGVLLRAAVAASIARGVFGSPTLIVDGEPFWGVETFGSAEAWLASGGW